jgi:hypothetical protein
MLIEDLIHQFILMKKREPSHLDELIHYIQRSYICGELSTVEYKALFLHLKKQKAKNRVKFAPNHNPYVCI